MANPSAEVLTPLPHLPAPPVVYFWGPVRAHVNRVALEYSLRFGDPVLLDVRGREPELESSEEGSPLPFERTFALEVPEDLQVDPAAPHLPVTSATLTREGEESALATQVDVYLDFPPAVASALELFAQDGGPTTLVVSNIDRLGHLSPLGERGFSKPLLAALRDRGITLVVTSKDIVADSNVPFECAFEVFTLPDQKWWEAEVRPGVPFSSCTSCPAAVNEEYASCSESFRRACPVIHPLRITAE